MDDTKKCGDCASYVSTTPSNAIGYCQALDIKPVTQAIWGTKCGKFIPRACSLCEHYHAEPRTDQKYEIFDGYCDAGGHSGNMEFVGVYGKGKTGIILKYDTKCDCNHFTLQAALLCKDCPEWKRNENYHSTGMCIKYLHASHYDDKCSNYDHSRKGGSVCNRCGAHLNTPCYVSAGIICEKCRVDYCEWAHQPGNYGKPIYIWKKEEGQAWWIDLKDTPKDQVTLKEQYKKCSECEGIGRAKTENHFSPRPRIPAPECARYAVKDITERSCQTCIHSDGVQYPFARCIISKGIECNPHGKHERLLYVAKACGRCGYYLKDVSVIKEGELQEGRCIKRSILTNPSFEYHNPSCTDFQEKSCALCGHFHAEPKGKYGGYCEREGDFYEYGKNQCGIVDGIASAERCDKFTPRGAPQLLGVVEMKVEKAPACARCNDIPTIREINIGKTNLVPICRKCRSTLYQRETAAGRTWFVDKNKVIPHPECARCGVDSQHHYRLAAWEDKYHHEMFLCQGCYTYKMERPVFTSWEDYKEWDERRQVPWACDKFPKIPVEKKCGNCLHFKDLHECQRYTKEDVPETIIMGVCELTQSNNDTEFVSDNSRCMFKPIKPESEPKMAFKCQQCGYANDEIPAKEVKKMKFCPVCGAALEGYEDPKRVAAVEAENAKLVANVAELTQRVTNQKDWLEIQERTAREENENLRAQIKKTQHVPQHVTWKCRNCPLRPQDGRCKSLLKAWGVRGFLGVTFCDSIERLEQLRKAKEKVPRKCRQCNESEDTKMRCGYHYKGCPKLMVKAAPRPLWRARLEYRIASRKHTRMVKKQQNLQKRDDYISWTKSMKEKTRKIQDDLAGRV